MGEQGEGAVALGQVSHVIFGWDPMIVATVILCAALLMFLNICRLPTEKQNKSVHNAFGKVEWDTIFFFIGLFIVVYGVEYTGLLSLLGQKLISLTGGDLEVTGYVILWVSSLFSFLINNIPFIATMIPLIESTAPSFGGPEALTPLWWCLALGGCLGGNGSLIAASANVMVASFSERAGHRISFMAFLKLSFPFMIGTIAVTHVYVWLMYFN